MQPKPTVADDIVMTHKTGITHHYDSSKSSLSSTLSLLCS